MSLLNCSVSLFTFSVTDIFLLGCVIFLNNINALILGQSARTQSMK